MQNSIEDSKDINDIFTDILLVEENLIDFHYNKGLELSATQDNTEAYHLGYHRGAEIGVEIGYYTAVVAHYSKLLEQSKDKNEQILTELGNFQELLSKFPSVNDADVDLLGEVEILRAKFKKIASKLKLKPVPFGKSELSF